ncbi:MAG: hypothetical protein LBK13_00170 [Spirochaetales bacterium]|jgi:hypothetical protein|nr:hypothetical protein [Spirochaetales bacterium]
MDFWKNNTIRFDDISEEYFINIDYKKNKSDMNFFQSKKYIILWYYACNGNDFINFPINNKLDYLELNWANNKSFRGIENIRGIKRLEVHYCTKLENDFGLSSLQETIEWLHIDKSKKFEISSELLSLKKLKVLCLNSCGTIASLDFLENFPDLIDFRFVDTNILDGNLKPIIEHPKLSNAGFIDKRHYNYKSNDLKMLIKGKNMFIKKNPVLTDGQETFRYNIFDSGKRV